MGDHARSPRVALLFFVFLFHFVPTAQVIDLVSLVHPRAQSSAIISCRIHPFPSAHTGRLVVRWGTTREVLVLRSFFVFLFHFVPTAQVIDLVSLVHPRAQSSAIISCRIHPLHTEVKRHRARLVVRWGTTRAKSSCCALFFVFLFHFVPTVQVIDLVSLVHPRAQSSAIISCRIHPFPSAHGS